MTSSGGTRSHHLGGEAASVQPNASIKLHTAEQPAALGADAGLGSFISESNGFISAGEGDESTQRHPDRSKETCSKCENLMYDWKSNTCTREEWESTPKHEKFYCTIRKPKELRYAEAKNRCVEKVHEAQKDCMKNRDCPLNHDFFQCCAAKAIGGDNGGIDSYCSRGKMEERGVRW